jgi:hypothetical protein
MKVVRGRLSSWPAPPLSWIGHAGAINCLSYSPNGWQIISGSSDKTIRIWDTETGAIIGEPLKGHTHGVVSVTYSPDGQHIASGSDDTTIRIWNAETGTAVGKPLEGHSERVLSVAYSPDGRHIISGSDDTTIRIWDAETGAVVGTPLEGHSQGVWSVAYSPNGHHIISGSGDKTIESGMPRLVLQLANRWRGIARRCCPLLTLPMGGTSSLDLLTTRFECGMPKPVPELVSLWRKKLRLGSALFLDLIAVPSVCQSHFHINHRHLVIPSMFIFAHSLTHKVGSETQTAAYSIGYPQIIVMAFILPLSLQCPLHLTFERCLLISKTLPLEPLGPKFSTVHSANHPILAIFVYDLVYEMLCGH